MCASYGALESTLVSTRSTVPGTLASAAARTFDVASPLSSFSVLPLTVCPPREGSRWAAGADDDEDEALPDVAAFAMAAPLAPAAAMAANVTSLLRMRTPSLDLRSAVTIAAARKSSGRLRWESPGTRPSQFYGGLY